MEAISLAMTIWSEMDQKLASCIQIFQFTNVVAIKVSLKMF